MPRFYVKDPAGNWNIFSTIVDDFLYEEFVPFETLEQRVMAEDGDWRMWKHDVLWTLLTDKPEVNTMSYEEAIETRDLIHGKQGDD